MKAPLEEYDSKKHIYEIMLTSSQRLIGDLLTAADIRVHSISGRVKGRDSLSEKLARKRKSYNELKEVTDLVGLRVVTYFEDDVDKVAELIKNEFTLVQEHCIDKRMALEPDRFGYLSLHYVCGLTEDRKRLRENGIFQSEIFEIQIRSLLQHAWAEIEHDLGYKREFSIPNEIKRQLFRVAGLLEIADRDFREVRDRSKAYGERVAERISRNETTRIELNSVSYKAFVVSSLLVRELDDFASQFSGLPPSPDEDIDVTVGCLRFVGIQTIDELQRALEENKDLLKRYASVVFTDGSHEVPFSFAEAISLFHLPQILAAKNGGVERVAEMYAEFNLASPSREGQLESATETISTLENLSKSYLTH